MEFGNASEDFCTVGIFGELFVFLIELILQGVNRAAGGDIIPDRNVVMFGRNGDFLRKIANTLAAKFDFAVIKLLLAENNAKKSGFAGAVDADNADFVARLGMEIAIVVNDFGAVGEMEIGGFHEDNYNTGA